MKSKATQATEEVAYRLNLKFGGATRAADVRVPTRPMDVVELLPVLQSLDNQVVELAEEATARQGKKISCCAGCGACCRQLVPISEPEAVWLARVVASMPPERRMEIERRFAAALETFERVGLLERLDTADQIPDEPTRGEFGLAYFRVGVACPFLENESCSIYADRPLACREFLVTSPAEECRSPGPDNVQPVPLPAQLSEKLYRFTADGNRQPARWFPLILALRYAASHADSTLPKQPGHELFGKFLSTLGGLK